ncbi:MAG: hypothetical protein L3J44_08520 [Campylobacteraceae bacterium]|nr:hypothetical protein [Campylobacteraceae bacterium]
MNKKIIILIFLIINTLYSVEVEIHRAKPAVTEQEINVLQKIFKKKFVLIGRKDARKYLINKKILANMALEIVPQQKIEEFLIKLNISVNKSLALMLLSQKAKNIKITDDIIESYYKTHFDEIKEKFRIIDMTIYYFTMFSDALNFYKTKKSSYEKKKEVKISINSISKIKDIILKTEAGKMTQPIFYNGKFIIFHINKKIVPQIKDVEKEIKNILRKKILDDIEKKLIRERK